MIPTPRLASLCLSLGSSLFASTPGCAAATSDTAPASSSSATTSTSDARPADRAGNVDLPRFPSISPDASTIVFSWRGDLWKVPSIGGQAIRLTTHPGDDLRSAWSPDGTRIAFDSNRTGFRNIHLMDADGTAVTRVTQIDRPCVLTAFGADEAGREILSFTASIETDIYRSARPYMISTDGGDIRRALDAFGSSPVVSPDGTRIAFTRGGSAWSRRGYRGPDARNVWLFNRADKSFRQLTTWIGNDGEPRWLGNSDLVFLSDRELNCVNLYRMNVADGESSIRRLTTFNVDDVQDFDVSATGSTAVFVVWDTLYTLDLRRTAAAPVALTISANEDEADNFTLKSIDREISEAALSPDGQVMATVAYGDVYIRNVDEGSPTRRVTSSAAREKQLAWSPDGLNLFFVSDSDGSDSIYSAAVTLTRGEIKEEFEKATKPVEPNPEPESDPTTLPATAPAGDEAPSASASQPESQPTAAQPSDTPAPAAPSDKKDDKKKEDEKPPKHLDPARWHDAMKFAITPVVANPAVNESNPTPSPDGALLAYRLGRGDLLILDLKTGDTRTLLKHWDFSSEWRWSPDSKNLAYHTDDRNFNSDIWILPADGSRPPANVTRHPDNDYNPRWSADGKVLVFTSERVNEEMDIWMIYLDKSLEGLADLDLQKYYKDAVDAAKKRKPIPVDKSRATWAVALTSTPLTPATSQPESQPSSQPETQPASQPETQPAKTETAAKPPFEWSDLEDAYLRAHRVSFYAGNEGNIEITPAGDYYLFSASEGETGLYIAKWDGSERKRIAPSASVQHLTLAGDKLVVVSAGRAATLKLPAGGSPEFVDITDRIRIDLQAQSAQKFLEAARIVGDLFYHPTLKDLDWPALSAKYLALARQTRRADEFNDVAARFLGELNGSHLGISAPAEPSPNAQSLGRLGITTRRATDGLEVLSILRDGPAAIGPMALKTGDHITAVELEPIAPGETLESRLTARTGLETVITIRRTPPPPPPSTQPESENPPPEASPAPEPLTLNLLLTPISWGQERALAYEDWRRHNAELVSVWSDGRIGYIHIEAMGQAALDVYERDLYAAADGKTGLIIDVRNNGGGSTADLLLASIMVQPHAYTVPRGADPTIKTGYPQDRLYIQRYTLPINMLCNEKSFSNAEIISHAFKTLKRGSLVGQQTYGGVISTGGTALIDGTFVRIPFRGWYLPDGTDMENHGAMPDILVPQTPQAESANSDDQLRAAVTDLLKRLP